MNLKNIFILVFFFSLVSCKTMLQCSVNEMEDNNIKKSNIEHNALNALRNYYDEEAKLDGGRRTELGFIGVNKITFDNDSTKVTFVVNGRYQTQGIADTSWTTIDKEESIWYYEEKNNKIYITK
jgi:hypothetical protein